MFETLDQRLLYAVSVQLDGTELNITGTGQPESVTVVKDGTKLKVTALTGAGPWYTSSQRQDWQFLASAVESIDARLKGSDDRFTTSSDLPVEMTVRGGAGDDDIKAYTDSYDGGDVAAYGEDGNDTIRVSYGSQKHSTIYGGEGDDYLKGGLWIDKIYGQGGSDLVIGGDGSDWLYGENVLSWDAVGGADTIVGGFGYDMMYGGPGDDLLTKWFDLSPWGDGITHGDGGEMYGDLGDDILDATDATFSGMELFGGYGNDLLIGSDAGDILTGGFGSDTLRGNAGDDTYYADDGYEDRIEHTTGGGNETIFSDVVDILV